MTRLLTSIVFGTGLLLLVASNSTLAAQETEAKAGDEVAEALKVGDAAPDFEAATFDDETITLSERFGEEGHPVVLLFSRANW